MKSGRLIACALGAVVFAGCSELRARSHARTGNEHFRAGDYAAAVRAFEQAEELAPGLPVIALNKGLACRQLMVPGGTSGAQRAAADCALGAFSRLRELAPNDRRGEQLYVQTLFDADRYDELARMYLAELAEKPDDALALNGLVQVYTRWQKPDEALRWMVERARRRPRDADAQYAVGVFVFSILLERGGGADKASYDPRPDAQANGVKERPLFSQSDIAGPRRVSLAELGIAHLERAIALRPGQREALIYANLLSRQKSFAYFDRPDLWHEAVQAAETYRGRAEALAPSSRAAAR